MQELAQRPTAEIVGALPAQAAQAVAQAAGTRTGVAEPSQGSASRRCFVTCGVRLSPEKNPMLFAELLEGAGAALAARGLVPILFGAAGDLEYSTRVKQRVAASPAHACIIEEHLNGEALAAIFSLTALNVHPCLYDAFGMSVVEAAAFGAPSLLHGEDTVGAAAFLGAGSGCFEASAFSKEELSEALIACLDDEERLAAVAGAARTKALGWSEDAAGEKLLGLLRTLVGTFRKRS